MKISTGRTPQKLLVGLVSGVAMLGLSTSFAAAEEMTEQVTFGWVSAAQDFRVEEGHTYSLATFSGSVIATGEPGLFQYAGAMCAGYLDIGMTVSGGGYCVFTTPTGTATAEWSCPTAPPSAQMPAGALLAADCVVTFISGTGVFTGISGATPYQGVIMAANPDGTVSGVSLYPGGLTYTLPN